MEGESASLQAHATIWEIRDGARFLALTNSGLSHPNLPPNRVGFIVLPREGTKFGAVDMLHSFISSWTREQVSHKPFPGVQQWCYLQEPPHSHLGLIQHGCIGECEIWVTFMCFLMPQGAHTSALCNLWFLGTIWWASSWSGWEWENERCDFQAQCCCSLGTQPPSVRS